MASVNKVILVGNLGRDPEVRTMPNNGEKVANFSVATTDTWKDKAGVRQEKTEWHNVVLYRRLAEIAEQYLTKGRPVYIEGSLQTRKWEKDGVTRYTTEIIGNSLQMLGKTSDGSNANQGQDQATPQQYQQASGGTAQQAPQQPAAQQPPAQPAAAGGGGFDDFDDDIPF